MAALASTEIPIAKEVPNPTAADIPLAQITSISPGEPTDIPLAPITSISPGESKESISPTDEIKASRLRILIPKREKFIQTLQAYSDVAGDVLNLKRNVLKPYSSSEVYEMKKINLRIKGYYKTRLKPLIEAVERDYKDLKKYENSKYYKKFVPNSERKAFAKKTDSMYIKYFKEVQKKIAPFWVKYPEFNYSRRQYTTHLDRKGKKTRGGKRKSHKKRNKGKRKTKKRRKRKTKRKTKRRRRRR